MIINSGEITMQLSSPLTEEQWDTITDADFEHTNSVWFHTKHGKDVEFVKVVRCADCKYFELNHVEHVDGIPLILAHQICTRWGNGCKTDGEGYCFMGERREVTE